VSLIVYFKGSSPTVVPQLQDWTIALIVILVALVVGSGTFLAIFFIQRDSKKRKKKRESVNMSPSLPSRINVHVTADDSHYSKSLQSMQLFPRTNKSRNFLAPLFELKSLRFSVIHSTYIHPRFISSGYQFPQLCR